MSERTDWDETVDRAIELLIAEDTESFHLLVSQTEDIHLVSGTDDVEESLLAVYLLVEDLRVSARKSGKPMTPDAILGAAATVASERGYLDPDRRQYEEIGEEPGGKDGGGE
jgi:hypothetical protein